MPLFALGVCDSFLVMLFLMFATMVGAIVLMGKAASRPDSGAQKLAGKAGNAAAGKAAEVVLGRLFKRF